MRLALDTNAYTRLARGDAHIKPLVQTAEEIHVPLVVLAELRAGFACGTLGKKNEATLTRFLNTDRVRVTLPDEQTAHHYANLFAQLRRQGTPIPTNDLWIAALALQHDLVLVTYDEHFKCIPQLVTA